MGRVQLFTLSAFVITFASVALPKIVFNDAKNLSEKIIARAKDSAYQYVFDSSIEPWLIIKLVVHDGKFPHEKQETVLVDAYTLFGLKYANVAVVYDYQTGAMVCIGRTYDIWQKDLANRTLPCG